MEGTKTVKTEKICLKTRDEWKRRDFLQGSNYQNSDATSKYIFQTIILPKVYNI